MKRFFKELKNIFFTAGLTFTCIVYLLTFTRTFIESKKENFLGTNQLSCILLFSVLLGVCGLVFMIPKLPKGVLRLIHFVASGIAFFFCIIVLTDLLSTPLYIFFALMLYTLAYFTVVGISSVIKRAVKRASAKEDEEEG